MDFFKYAMKLAHESVAAKAVKQRLEARHVRALASKRDPVRHDFELGLADRMDAEARLILIPPKPLQMGLGGEIVPSAEDGLPGIESVLQEPDLLNAEASKQRAHLLERTGSLEIGVEVAEQAGASNAIEKMLCHQMAAAHRRAMGLIERWINQPTITTLFKQAKALQLKPTEVVGLAYELRTGCS
jgi:hypothetical protein